MAIKRVMGTETEYGIVGEASDVLNNYRGKKQNHENKSLETNRSAITGMVDLGHIGGDYEGQAMDLGIVSSIGYRVAGSFGFSEYFGRDDMLANGARFYIDMGHPEYSTPECSDPVGAVIADKAGEKILEAASEGGQVARIFKNNTDGFNSYGAHENYFVDRSKVPDFNALAQFTIPFFVSRPIFTGSGKIGFREEKSRELQRTMQGILDAYASLRDYAFSKVGELYERVREGLENVVSSMREDEFVFQISQRADFFSQVLGLQTTHNRPIINTRDEPLSDGSKYMRFHVINGDANLSEIAMYLKLGTTALVLDLFEDRKMQPIELDDPVKAFHAISKDPTLVARVGVRRQGEMTAIEMQRQYFEAAQAAYKGRDEMTDDILNRWKFFLDALQENPMKLNRQVDWVIKKGLIDSYMSRQGKKLGDTQVRNIDLQYHEVSRKKGLFYILQNRGFVDRLISDEQIQHAVENAPEDTRAWMRGELVRRNNVSSADWDKISLRGQHKDISIPDPFMGTKAAVGHLFTKGIGDDVLMVQLEAKGYTQERFYAGINRTGGKKYGTRKKIRKV